MGAVDVGCSTSLFSPELGGLGGDNHLAERIGTKTHVNIEVIGLGELQCHVLDLTSLITDVAYRNRVRTTGSHTTHGIASVDVGNGVVLGARGRVQRGNRGANQRLLVFIGHDTGHCRGRHLSTCRQCHEEHCHQSQKLNCSQHTNN